MTTPKELSPVVEDAELERLTPEEARAVVSHIARSPVIDPRVTNWRHFAEGYAKIVHVSEMGKDSDRCLVCGTSWTATERLPCPACTPDSAMRERND